MKKQTLIPAAGTAALLLLCLGGCGQQIKDLLSYKVKEERLPYLYQ